MASKTVELTHRPVLLADKAVWCGLVLSLTLTLLPTPLQARPLLPPPQTDNIAPQPMASQTPPVATPSTKARKTPETCKGSRCAHKGKDKPLVFFPEPLQPQSASPKPLPSSSAKDAFEGNQAATPDSEAGMVPVSMTLRPERSTNAMQPASYWDTPTDFTPDKSSDSAPSDTAVKFQDQPKQANTNKPTSQATDTEALSNRSNTAALNPDSERTEALRHYNRGAYFGQMGQMEEAIQEYQEALRLKPDLADAYVALSSAYMKKNNWERVIRAAQQALSMQNQFLDPENIRQAQFNLGAAYCAADDYPQASAYYQKVYSVGDDATTHRLQAYLEKNCKP